MRERRRRRGARGGVGLKPLGTTIALLRPALEAAVAVARDGERATPPVPAPTTLRRYLGFARLPDPALEVARKVLDDDADFRDRVAAAVDEATVGRAGWLFLTRPDGWQADIEALRNEAAAEELAAREDRAERSARRKLAGAEAAAARAEAAALAATAEAERLQAELEEERKRAATALAEVERLTAEVAGLREERATLLARLKETEATAAQRASELRAVRHELRMAQAELALAAGTDGVAGTATAPPPEPEPAVPPAWDEVTKAVREAAGVADRLASVLAAASALVDGDEPAADGGATDGSGAAPRPRRERRRPLRLPPAVLDDSEAAAEHLVKSPGALLLVDGYNISHAQWHGMPPAEQRTRLLDACAELHARWGAEVEVVFDGSGDEATAGTLVRADVKYRFTPTGVEADDVVLARVEEEPPARPVIVASSDRRVRDGARARGANVIGAKQFLSVLRR